MASEHSHSSPSTVPPPSPTPMRRPNPRQLLSNLLVNLVLPVVGYFLLRSHVSSDTIALALVTAVPVLRTLVVLVTRRRIDPIGVLATVVFGAAAVISWLSGGGSLPFKSSEAILTAILGLGCLVSVLIGKPLHLMAVQSRSKEPLPPTAYRTSRVVTLMLAVTFLLHAAVHITFALTMDDTGSFLIVSRAVGWVVIAAGLGVIYLYTRSQKRRSGTGEAATDGAPTHQG